MRTTSEQINERLLEGFDPDSYDSIDKQCRYAFGDAWDRQSQSSSSMSGAFPYWPDINPKELAVGQSRRILNHAFIGLSKVMYNDGEPEYPTLDPMKGEARKGFIKARARGDGYESGAWTRQEEDAFLEGDGTGLGFLQIGLMKGKFGKQMVTVRHSPALMTIGDRMERSPDRWRWVCFVQLMPADKALAIWGDKVTPYIKESFDSTQGRPSRVVRLFEYYDLGYGKGDPTRAVIPGDFKEKPLIIEENPFECLPLSYYEHFYTPGMRRAVGRIVLQMANHEALNEVEEYMLSVMQTGKGFDIADESAYEKQDLKQVRSGKHPRLVRRIGTRTGDWERVDPMQLSQSAIVLLQHLEGQGIQESGITAFDKGMNPAGNRTLGENMLVDQRGATQGAWSVRQLIKFRERTYDKVVKIARDFDREPVEIPFFDGQVTLNDPNDPNTWLDQVFAQDSPPVISEEALTYRDVLTRRAERIAYLQSIFPMVQMGVFNPQWWAQEMLKAGGEKDIQAAMGQPAGAITPPEQVA